MQRTAEMRCGREAKSRQLEILGVVRAEGRGANMRLTLDARRPLGAVAVVGVFLLLACSQARTQGVGEVEALGSEQSALKSAKSSKDDDKDKDKDKDKDQKRHNDNDKDNDQDADEDDGDDAAADADDDDDADEDDGDDEGDDED